MPESASRPAPLLAADLTAPWLEQLLSDGQPGVRVASVAVDPPIAGMSVKHRLHVRYRDACGLPPTLVVKGSFGRHGPEWDWMYEGEMQTYRGFLREVPIDRPHTYFAGHEPTRGTPILLMEDLDTSARFNEVRRTLDLPQAIAFVDAFAGLHAAFWESPELAAGGRYAHLEPMLSGFVLEYFERVTTDDAWQHYLTLPRGAIVPRSFTAARMRRALRGLIAFRATSPSCIVHGDCHLGNTYLRHDGRPGFVDWQIKRGPWHQDFSYFLVSALDIEDRRRWERLLVERYVSQIAARGVRAPSLEQAMLGYRVDILYGLLVWITNGDDQGQYQPEVAQVGNTARFVAAALDLDVLSLVD